MPGFATMAADALVNLLVLLGAAFVLSRGFRYKQSLPAALHPLASGLGFGLLAVSTMMDAFPIGPGLIGDFRNAVVAVAAVVGGPLAALIAAAVAIAARIVIGGAVGLAAIGIAIGAALSIGFARLPFARRPLALALFGLALAAANALLPVIAAAIAGQSTAGTGALALTILAIAGPAYPCVMVVMGGLLLDEQRRARDETELKRANAELAREAARGHGLFESAGVPMLWGDFRTGQVLRVNAAYADFLGYGPGELEGRNFRDLMVPEDREQNRRLIAPYRAGTASSIAGEARYMRKDGTIAWGYRTLTAIKERGAPRYTFSVVQDITEQKRAREEINRLVAGDLVTGLLNRLAFTAELTEAVARRDPSAAVAVICFDVGDLPGAKDVIGRLANHRTLTRAGHYLREAAGEGHVLARIVGGTFALIPTGVADAAGAERLAEAVAARVAELFAAGERPLSPRISVGIALAPEHGEDAENLILKAEIARDAARDAAPHCRVFEPRMEAALLERQEIKADLGLALVNNELELHYQPVVSLHTGAVVSMEALIRWRHPRRGMIAPADFIPIAEESGLIAPIGEWVLNQACRDAGGWPAHVGVAVNVSPIQFNDRTLPLRIASLLARTRLAAGRLEVEITESVFLSTGGASLKLLEEIRQLGVRIALDDFGTGYSSLSYLQHFAFDKIKIDRAFVSDIASREESKAVFRAVTELGQSLSIAITAEGVETREQLDSVRNHGCDQVQGFLFSPPVPAGEVVPLIERIEGRPAQILPASRFTRR
jgi:PAS domain S-box-containing protein/diguanylate cyclase (GGDEF)-like protein